LTGPLMAKPLWLRSTRLPLTPLVLTSATVRSLVSR